MKLLAPFGVVTLNASSVNSLGFSINGKTTSISVTGAGFGGPPFSIDNVGFFGTPISLLLGSGLFAGGAQVLLSLNFGPSLTLPSGGGIDSLQVSQGGVNFFKTLIGASENWPNSIDCSIHGVLSSITIPATVNEGTNAPGNVTFNGCALNSASVSALLAFYAGLVGQAVDISGLQLDISGGTNAVPNGTTDAANITIITGAGGTVTHN